MSKTISPFHKKLIKILPSSIVIIVAISSNFSQAALTPLANQYIQQAQDHRSHATSAEKESYYYSLGLSYVTNPIAIGKAIYDGSKTRPVEDFAVPKFKKPSEFHLTCKFDEESCLEAIVKQSTLTHHTSSTVATDADFILNRYYQFLTNPPAVTLADNFSVAPQPDYSYLYLGQRLSFTQGLRLAQAGQVDKAMDNSLYELSKLRDQLANADMLVSKMTAYLMIYYQLQQIIVLQEQFQPKTVRAISPLTAAEKDMKLPLLNDFYHNKMVLEKAQSEMDESTKQRYRHDDTINAYADYIHEQIKVTALTPTQFAMYRKNLQPDAKSLPIKANPQINSVGYQLANIAVPDYQAFNERILSIDNLINTTNFVLSDGKSPLTNVFDPSVTGFTDDGKRICMMTPKLAKQSDNCLITKKRIVKQQ